MSLLPSSTSIAERFVAKLAMFPNRGTPRDELHPGMRSVTFERRYLVFYQVDGRRVEVVRVIDRSALSPGNGQPSGRQARR